MSSARPLRVVDTADHDINHGIMGANPRVPVLPVNWLTRDRLTRRLEAGENRRLTLGTGGPGRGATGLLAGGATERPVATTAWRAVKERDNDPRRFWSHLLTALRSAGTAMNFPVR